MIQVIDKLHYKIIQIQRPEAKNALSLQMLQDLTQVFVSLAQDANLRFIVIEGAGDVFCSGADLNDMKNAATKDFKANLADALVLHGMYEALFNLPLPVICRIQGAAMGGALGLVALSDYVIAEPATRLAFSEVRLGIAPAVIADFILRKFSPSCVGHWMLLGDFFTSEQAQAKGLVHEVTDKGGSSKALEKRVAHLLTLGPKALRHTKRLIRQMSQNLSDDERREYVTHLIADLRVSPEGQEGLAGFTERKTPSWVVGS